MCWMRAWACVCVGVVGNKDAVAVDCKLLRRGVVKFAVEAVPRVLCVQAAAAAAAAIAKLNCIFNTAALCCRSHCRYSGCQASGAKEAQSATKVHKTSTAQTIKHKL